MAVTELERSGRETITGRAVDEKVDRLVGAAMRLQLEPGLSQGERLRELLLLADHDGELLGRAWLHVEIDSLSHPSISLSNLAGLLSRALDLQVLLLDVEAAS